MKKFIVILLILLCPVLFASNAVQASAFTNINDKAAYVFIQSHSTFGKQRRIINAVMSGSISLGFFIGSQVTKDAHIKRLCLIESACFLILTPLVCMSKSVEEKLITRINQKEFTPVQGLKKYSALYKTGRIIASTVYIGAGGYLIYEGINWARNSVYKKGDYSVLYFLGFGFAASGIVNLFIKHPYENFYDSIKKGELLSSRYKFDSYVCDKNIYNGISYHF